MPTLKQVFTLPTKAQWVEIARRVVVTFGSAFSASLAANEAGLTNLHSVEVVALAAGAAGINALYRVFVTPAVATAKADASETAKALGAEVSRALVGAQPLDLRTVLAALPDDLVLKVLQAPITSGVEAAHPGPETTFIPPAG
ncbi:MAG TPA: hypothetical protein VNM39_13400 [Verrucomicrobiae bacterium]|nr:hypothetical protein [Verrucomicrobiae bacterium]